MEKKNNNLLYYVMTIYQWWRQWDNESFFSFPKTACSQCNKVQGGKTFYIHPQSFLLYYHWEYKHKRICFVKYTCSLSSLGAELWWLNSLPSDTGIPHLSTLTTLSNRHSWLAFPSHWRKYKSLLLSCTTASMHFPERMWTIIPFWKEGGGGRKKKEKEMKTSQFPAISQQRSISLSFVLIIMRIIEVVWTGLVRNCTMLVNINYSLGRPKYKYCLEPWGH